MTFAEMADLEAACFPYSTTWDAAEFAQHVAKPNAILVNFDGGFISGRVATDEAEIITIAVEKSFRRTGVATRMIADFEVKSRSLGARSIFLEVSEANKSARFLYDKVGFKHVGTRTNYYRLPNASSFDALIFKKDL